MPEREIRYEIEPREKHVPHAVKPEKGERYPLIEDEKLVAKLKKVIESVGYERISDLKEEIRELDNKLRELRAKEKELVAKFGEKAKVEGVLEDLWEYFERRYGQIEEFDKKIHQIILKGEKLKDLLITPTREEYVIHTKELYDPAKLEVFLDFAKRVGVLTDKLIETVFAEIEKANKAIEKTAEAIEEVRKIYVKEPSEVDIKFLASKRAGIMDTVMSYIRRIINWFKEVINTMLRNDDEIEEIIMEVDDIVREVDEIYGIPIIGSSEETKSIAERVWEKYSFIGKDIVFYHNVIDIGDVVCFREAPSMCGTVVNKRGYDKWTLEFDIKFPDGSMSRRVMWWDVELQALEIERLKQKEKQTKTEQGKTGNIIPEVGLLGAKVGYVDDELIIADSEEDLIWKMFDSIVNVCNCEKKAMLLIENAVEKFLKTGAGWKGLPAGWTMESVRKFWNSLTGDVKHKVTKCIELMEDKMDDPEAFCASVKDMVEGTTKWRGK